MLPVQQVVDLEQNDDMLEDGDAQLREQVMGPRERGHQQVIAVQDRQFAFANAPANVVEENRRREYREHREGGNVMLEQRNILQQVIHQFQQPPQLEMILENQRDVLHQLVQEAHRVRQEVKDIKDCHGPCTAKRLMPTMQGSNKPYTHRANHSMNAIQDCII